ncbi:MAG: hypothetical protein ACLQBB_14760 [Solirubrobacteraceae bacterium]
MSAARHEGLEDPASLRAGAPVAHRIDFGGHRWPTRPASRTGPRRIEMLDLAK